MGRHIYYLDNLRTCAIFLSLLAIALGTFMPEPLMPAYYISDMQAGPRWGTSHGPRHSHPLFPERLLRRIKPPHPRDKALHEEPFQKTFPALAFRIDFLRN